VMSWFGPKRFDESLYTLNILEI